MSKTGRLTAQRVAQEKVKIRDHWPKEADDFTPWMVNEGGLDILADALGLKLDSAEHEVKVGSFRADILCKDTADDSNVVIENQYENSDHAHIGKLLTYSADSEAHTVIWIAEKFRVKHRKVLNHLNEITDERFRYFAVKVSLWRIGDSKPAPRFDIVCKPSGWEQRTQNFDIENLSDTEKLRIDYWNALQDYMNNKGSHVKFRKVASTSYLDCSRRDGFGISAHLVPTRNEIGVSLYMVTEDSIERFDLIERQREEIENELEETLEWTKNRVYLPKKDTDPRDKADWENQHEWLMSKLELFDKVFRPRIREINNNWKNKEESQTDPIDISTNSDT